MEIIDVLNNCSIDGNVVKLPNVKLDRKLYMDVAKRIELIGGKWNRKAQGFLFEEDPSELFEDICNGDNRNLKKEYQFFETPAEIADKMVSLACIENQNQSVLEPSAGRGAIVEAITRQYWNKLVDCYELMEINRRYLAKNSSVNLIGDDFLKADPNIKYDRVIANPPFNKHQYIDHIYKMYEVLKVGGVLVTIAPTSFMFNTSKKEVKFEEWVVENSTCICNLDEGAFKSSGTNIKTMIIVIRKEE